MEQSLFDLVPDYFPEWLNQNNLESGTGGDYRLEQEGQLRFERYPRTFNQISTRSGFDGFSKCRKVTVGYSIHDRDVICLVLRSPARMRYDTLDTFLHPSIQHTGRPSPSLGMCILEDTTVTLHTYSILCTYSILLYMLRIPYTASHPDDSWIIPIN